MLGEDRLFVPLAGSTFKINLATDVNKYENTVCWKGKSHLQQSVELSSFVVDWFHVNKTKPSSPLYRKERVTIYTEYKYNNGILRAHYRSN